MKIVGMAAQRERLTSFGLAHCDIVGLAEIVERKQLLPSNDACRFSRFRVTRL